LSIAIGTIVSFTGWGAIVGVPIIVTGLFATFIPKITFFLTICAFSAFLLFKDDSSRLKINQLISTMDKKYEALSEKLKKEELKKKQELKSATDPEIFKEKQQKIDFYRKQLQDNKITQEEFLQIRLKILKD
jgi:hypothetical protein